MRARLAAAAAVVLIVTAAWVVPASAQYVGGQPPTIGQGPGARAAADRAAADRAAAAQAAQAKKVRIARVIRVGASSLTASRSGGFAVTGTDITQLVLIGGSLIAVGAVLTRGARRRVAVTGGALH